MTTVEREQEKLRKEFAELVPKLLAAGAAIRKSLRLNLVKSPPTISFNGAPLIDAIVAFDALQANFNTLAVSQGISTGQDGGNA